MGLEDRQYYRQRKLRFQSGILVWSDFDCHHDCHYQRGHFPAGCLLRRCARGAGMGRLNSCLGVRSDHPFYFWTYLTHGFAHASYKSDIGIWHIAGNMITLWFLGRPVEYRLGIKGISADSILTAIVVSGLGICAVADCHWSTIFCRRGLGWSFGRRGVVHLHVSARKNSVDGDHSHAGLVVGSAVAAFQLYDGFQSRQPYCLGGSPGRRRLWCCLLSETLESSVELHFGGIGKSLKPRPKLRFMIHLKSMKN